jgi:hypothetical protein
VDCESGYITVNEGTLKANTGGDGLKSIENMTVGGGKIEIESNDNGIITNGNMVVTGGEIYCYSGKDGIISTEGTIAILDGLTVASATKNVFSCGKTFSITEGTAIGVGNATSLPTESDCRQRSVVWSASKFTAGQLIYIKSPNNSEVLTFKLPRAYSGNMALVFTSPALQANTEYTIYKGGTVSGGSDFHGWYSGAVSSGGAAAATFNISSMVTVVGK